MEPSVVYNIQPGVIWDWRVATDLFLGGVGVGAFLLAFVLHRFAGPAYRGLAQTAAVIAPIAVSLGLLLLFWKLGYKLHAYQMGLNVAPTSTMWWGAMIQGAFVALSALYAWRLLAPRSTLLGFLSTPLVGVVGAVLAVVIGVYHGFLLATITSHPVWSTGAMVMASVVLFSITGPSAALVLHALRRGIGATGSDEPDGAAYAAALRPLGLVLLGGTLLLLLTMVAWWADLRFGTAAGRQALSALLGSYGWLVGLVGLGLGSIVPLALLASTTLGRPGAAAAPSPALIALACLLILIGGYAIRYSAVLGGQIAPPAATFGNLS